MHYRRTTVKQMKSWLHSLWWRVGGVARGAGEESALNPAVVVCRGLPEAGFSVRTFFLSFQKHKGGGKHVGCGFTYAPAFK